MVEVTAGLSRKTTQPSLWSRPVAGWVVALVLTAVLAFVGWLALSVRIGLVPSDSMEPTLLPGDYYVIRIDAYRHAPPQRGDIVVIKHPAAHETLVKRVIAVGGDTVGVLFGRVILNGSLLEEPYIEPRPGIRERPVLLQVPEGELFVLGDNRNFSEDSRDIGTLPVKNVIGKVVAIVWPPSRRRVL